MLYGWVAVAISFTTPFLVAGGVFYVFGVVFKNLAADIQSGRPGVSDIPMAMPWTGALIAPSAYGPQSARHRSAIGPNVRCRTQKRGTSNVLSADDGGVA